MKPPNWFDFTDQEALKEVKFLLTKELNEMKQHLARRNHHHHHLLPGQEVMHRGNQQAFFFPFQKVTFGSFLKFI